MSKLDQMAILAKEPRTKEEAQNWLRILAEIRPPMTNMLMKLKSQALRLANRADSAESVVKEFAANGPFKFADLAKAKGEYTVNTIRQTMFNLATAGELVRIAPGTYVLNDPSVKWLATTSGWEKVVS